MKILAIIITAIAIIAGITTVSIMALADSVSEFDLHYSDDHYDYN